MGAGAAQDAGGGGGAPPRGGACAYEDGAARAQEVRGQHGASRPSDPPTRALHSTPARERDACDQYAVGPGTQGHASTLAAACGSQVRASTEELLALNSWRGLLAAIRRRAALRTRAVGAFRNRHVRFAYNSWLAVRSSTHRKASLKMRSARALVHRLGRRGFFGVNFLLAELLNLALLFALAAFLLLRASFAVVLIFFLVHILILTLTLTLALDS